MIILRRITIAFLCLLIGSHALKAQLQDHLYFDNKDSSLIRGQKITELHSFITEFKNEKARKKRLYCVEKYNHQGLITSYLDLSIDNDSLDCMVMSYDSHNRLDTIKWYNKGKVTQRTVYSYNLNGQLIKECDYEIRNGVFTPYEYQNFYYISEKLDKVTDSNNNTLAYYRYKKNRAYRFNKHHKIVSHYRDGLQNYLGMEN